MPKQLIKLGLGLALIASLAACKEKSNSADSQSGSEKSVTLSSEMTAEDSERLHNRLVEYEAQTSAGNFGELFLYIPPKVRAELLDQTGVSEALMMEQMDLLMGPLMERMTILKNEFDLDAYPMSMSSTGVKYQIVPTYIEMTSLDMPGQKIVAESVSFALTDNNDWYLVRLDEPLHKKIFSDVYPELADVETPEASMNIVGLDAE